MQISVALAAVLVLVHLCHGLAPAQVQSPPDLPRFDRAVIDRTAESNVHKPKVLARFSGDRFNDLGGLDRNGFRLCRFTKARTAYTIIEPGDHVPARCLQGCQSVGPVVKPWRGP